MEAGDEGGSGIGGLDPGPLDKSGTDHVFCKPEMVVPDLIVPCAGPTRQS